MNKLLMGFLMLVLLVIMTSCIVEKEVVYRNKYTEVEIEVIVEKEIIVEKDIELREFASLEELEEWLAADRTDGKHLIFSTDSTISLDGGKSPGVWTDPNYEDCDDYAVALQREGMKSGFLINIQIDTRKKHALNSVLISNEIYFIEPQDDEVWLECYRDKE